MSGFCDKYAFTPCDLEERFRCSEFSNACKSNKIQDLQRQIEQLNIRLDNRCQSIIDYQKAACDQRATISKLRAEVNNHIFNMKNTEIYLGVQQANDRLAEELVRVSAENNFAQSIVAAQRLVIGDLKAAPRYTSEFVNTICAERDQLKVINSDLGEALGKVHKQRDAAAIQATKYSDCLHEVCQKVSETLDLPE